MDVHNTIPYACWALATRPTASLFILSLYINFVFLNPVLLVRNVPYPEGVREYIGCTTNSTPQRGLGVLLKCTFLMPGVPPGVPCPIPLVKVVHEEYTLYHTHAAGVLELAYTPVVH